MPSEFSVQISDENDTHTKVIHLNGELDEMSIENLKNQIDPFLNDKNVQRMIFDFTQLDFINSKGIGYMVATHTHMTKNARAIAIFGATEPVMDVISLVGLTNIIPYYATLEEALSK